ncbi:putative Ubiquitin-like domain, BAG domain superfamily, molecular chaperone regulator BAG [Helianthus annuus]|nr:putative Ubiquitin-like domain, BAG domain superfamily, molecular chaperone regulator BAG [Helianthus annuus]KAJ0760497.1 putative Ubiquitin-like domain, BAG domain superfamily, molecular chaperone regulator BAG [Helianthus annuus]
MVLSVLVSAITFLALIIIIIIFFATGHKFCYTFKCCRICSSNRVNWASTYMSQNNTYNKKTLVANNPLTIRVRVKYGSIYHGINNSSQATFGELKKMLLGPTGLHHEDKKLMYKNKERSSKTFLDVVGVKDLSKMVLVEDPISQERRYVEMRKNAMMEKAAKAISQISLEVDRLAGQVHRVCVYIGSGFRENGEKCENGEND